MEKKPEFDKVDLIHLKHLKEMIRDNLVLKDVECVDVSKIFHVFQWVESIEDKVKDHFELKISFEDKKEESKHEKARLISEIRQLEIELKEAKKPKRKPRAKKVAKK